MLYTTYPSVGKHHIDRSRRIVPDAFTGELDRQRGRWHRPLRLPATDVPGGAWPPRGWPGDTELRLEGLMNLDRITSNPARMNGQPCVRDLRLTVRRVVQLVATYPDRNELRREFPELDDEDIRQALAFAAAALDDRVIELTGHHETAA